MSACIYMCMCIVDTFSNPSISILICILFVTCFSLKLSHLFLHFLQALKASVEEMAHSRGDNVAGGTPTPSPSGSGQTATNMELTHTDRAGRDI